MTLDRAAIAPVGLALAHAGVAAVAGWCFTPAGLWATIGLAAVTWTAAGLDPASLGWASPAWRGVARDGVLRLAMLGSVALTLGLARRAVRGVLRAEDTLAVRLVQERDSARRDRLTRLWNARYLYEALEREIARCRRYGRPFGLLVLDLDGFKAVNDSHGHAAGDEVLQVVARVLHENCRVTDVPARLGGDEFAVIMPGVRETAVAVAAAHRILSGLQKTIDVAGRPLQIRCSIGIALSDEDMADPKELLHRADTAMYGAKRHGLHGVEVYGENLDEADPRRSQLQADLRRAIERQEPGRPALSESHAS
jgi:diguanylate cyclase (GGDEF)-like protein